MQAFIPEDRQPGAGFIGELADAVVEQKPVLPGGVGQKQIDHPVAVVIGDGSAGSPRRHARQQQRGLVLKIALAVVDPKLQLVLVRAAFRIQQFPAGEQKIEIAVVVDVGHGHPVHARVRARQHLFDFL